VLGVVVLEAIVAINVAPPFGEKIAKNRPELAGMDKGIEIRDRPTPNSPNPIQGLVVSSSHSTLLNAPNLWDVSASRFSIGKIIGVSEGCVKGAR
jgi:hypothetical protein